MEWMLPWFIGLGIFSWVAVMSLMVTGGVPPAIQALGVITLLVFTGLVAKVNQTAKDAPVVEHIR